MHEDAAGTQAARPANRPALHLTAQSGWINDPMGLTYHDGRYHMFFQYVPAKILWGPQCWWGHAVSEDLLSWTEREPILRPGDGDGGCWSGSLAVDDAGRATIFYTSVQLDDLDLGQIRTAQPDDVTWNTWQKGPFVEGINPTSDIVVFRDPQVSRDANGWQMIVGAGRRDDTAVALSYRSPDLLNWTSEGEFASRSSAVREPVWTGKVWECPQLITVGSKHVLLFSVWEPQIPTMRRTRSELSAMVNSSARDGAASATGTSTTPAQRSVTRMAAPGSSIGCGESPIPKAVGRAPTACRICCDSTTALVWLPSRTRRWVTGADPRPRSKAVPAIPCPCRRSPMWNGS